MNINFLIRRIYRIKVLGIANLIRCIYWRVELKKIVKKHEINIDNWHIKNNFYCKPYKWKVIEIVNSLNPEYVVEIGCGLGEIISRIKADYKIGIDIDDACLNIARLLNGKPVYLKGSFNDFNKLYIPFEQIDCLIMINFLHGIEKHEVAENIIQIINSIKCKYIITDWYKEDYPERGEVHDLSNYDSRIKLVNIYNDNEGYRYIIRWRVEYDS